LTALTGTPFSGHSFPPAVIGLAGLCYCRSRLSDADVVEWLAERYIQVDPSTVFDWVQKFAPWYQDAVQNEAKHAPGALVTITLSWTGEELQLRIRDDGPGFDPEAVWPKARLGLVSMRERAEFVGGSFVLHSAIDAGTEIEVRVPWSSMQRAG
jgi:hypothetical protein